MAMGLAATRRVGFPRVGVRGGVVHGGVGSRRHDSGIGGRVGYPPVGFMRGPGERVLTLGEKKS